MDVVTVTPLLTTFVIVGIKVVVVIYCVVLVTVSVVCAGEELCCGADELESCVVEEDAGGVVVSDGGGVVGEEVDVVLTSDVVVVVVSVTGGSEEGVMDEVGTSLLVGVSLGSMPVVDGDEGSALALALLVGGGGPVLLLDSGDGCSLVVAVLLDVGMGSLLVAPPLDVGSGAAEALSEGAAFDDVGSGCALDVGDALSVRVGASELLAGGLLTELVGSLSLLLLRVVASGGEDDVCIPSAGAEDVGVLSSDEEEGAGDSFSSVGEGEDDSVGVPISWAELVSIALVALSSAALEDIHAKVKNYKTGKRRKERKEELTETNKDRKKAASQAHST